MDVTIDQKFAALTNELHQTQSELADTRRELDEVKQNAPKSRRSGEWQKLWKEINEYVNTLAGTKVGHLTSLPGAISTVIRLHVNIRNVNQINETNIDEARKTFEALKKII
ncbi:hypothetical protein YK48G_04370 [Lentilactobacillus fungorum]|uniref:DUF5082 domain-containing protein n=1 Tax=Lentilactobacillus fungorum TaxID=2201250 RepID=A0ABQ3VVU7_9LACO|nr:hypothetical protein [Lentilactobacillus fungorum]GHP13012.1 hypothetical protein YK48G_04370 [Lentilactobacillus fungorum]